MTRCPREISIEIRGRDLLRDGRGETRPPVWRNY